MGMFTSYCKKCNHKINWFLRLQHGYTICKNCEEINLQDEVWESLNNKKYWNIKYRKDKIIKIINKCYQKK